MVQKRSEKGLLTPDNCVVAFIDLQPQMLFGVSSHDRQSIINSNVILAKAARVFNVPIVLSAVATKSFSGYTWPQLLGVLVGQESIERTSMNVLSLFVISNNFSILFTKRSAMMRHRLPLCIKQNKVRIDGTIQAVVPASGRSRKRGKSW